MVFAGPAGAIIWLFANVTLSGASLAEHMIGFLDPFGLLLGLNGVILVAYIVAIPANEIVVPTILMLTLLVGGLTGVGAGAGVMVELDSAAIEGILRAGGWTLPLQHNHLHDLQGNWQPPLDRTLSVSAALAGLRRHVRRRPILASGYLTTSSGSDSQVSTTIRNMSDSVMMPTSRSPSTTGSPATLCSSITRAASRRG